METPPPATGLLPRVEALFDTLLVWATTPSGWVQAFLVAVSLVLAPLLARLVRSRLSWFRDVPGPDAVFQNLVHKIAPFLRALLLVALLMVGLAIAMAILGQSALVRMALGLALVFLLYRMIKTLLPRQIHRIAYLVLIPLGLLAVVGLLDDLTLWLDTTYSFEFLGTSFTPTKILRIIVLGALLFWLGGVFNTCGQTVIRRQETLDIGVREIMAKIFQIVLFVALALMLLSVASIPLSGLVVVISAVGLGIGLGLQSVAANFVSGLIILLDRSVRIGDFIQMDDGMSGTVAAINMRSTTLETADGKDILIPNLNFIDGRYENWTHSDPAQRYEVAFAVHYGTDLDSLEGILIPEILKYEKLLTEPELPDLELRSFGDHGINMAIEFWAEGIDDGANKFTSDIAMIIWRTLKEAGVEMPYHQLVIHSASPEIAGGA